MSKMLMDLAGKRCSIVNEDEEYLTGSPDIVCDVLEVDDEWIKIAFTDQTGQRVTKLNRLETVESVEIFL